LLLSSPTPILVPILDLKIQEELSVILDLRVQEIYLCFLFFEFVVV